MRLIDADALESAFATLIYEFELRAPKWSPNDMLTSGRDTAMKYEYKADGVESALNVVRRMPTIDAEAVKHGAWLPHKITSSVICSNCRRVFSNETPHCPNCGARMDGDST